MLNAWCGGVSAGCRVWLLTAVLLASTAYAQREPPGAQREPPGAQPEAPGAPRCVHPRCNFIGHNITYNDWKNYYYEVEGNAMTIIMFISRPKTLRLDCYGNNVLGSPALPRAAPTHPVSYLELRSCSLPATGSLGDSFAALNVTLCQQDEPCELSIGDLQDGPRPAAQHFVGLERLRTLEISTTRLTDTYTQVTAEPNVLMALTNLRKLSLSESMTLPAELDALPPLLDNLHLYNTDMKRLPKVIYSSANLRKLVFSNHLIPLDAVEVPPGLRKLDVWSPASTLRLDVAPTLESLFLENWVEELPPPISRCDKLRDMTLFAPAMRALPHGWLANCSRLEKIFISEANNLITLPPTLFSPDNRLKQLNFVRGALETLQEGVLDDLRVLEGLHLTNNYIKKLPRNLFKAFIHYPLSHLGLSSNDLDGSVLDALEPLPQDTLTGLVLSDNPRIGDYCGVDGYSPIRWFVNLRTLHLRDTGATRICTDWREDLLDLELLDLNKSNISELAYKDLQFTRTVQAQVRLSTLNPLSALRVTREDYNDAVGAPPSFTSVDIHAELECDCSTYWARRVLDDPLARLSLPGFHYLRCDGGGLLRDVPAEELECGAREECAAAALPAECACTARPDDDPTHDCRLVRAHCGNSSRGFVPRRMYPFYPIHQSNNQGAYMTQFVASMN